MREKPSMLRREVSDATHLVRGDVEAAIVYPAGDIAYKSLAQAVRAVINQHTGISLDFLTDTDIINKRDEPFPEDYQNRPLIVLGSINTNRVLLPLYARFFCATDAAFPGGAGYELRTMVNPYGTESNIILLGGSTIEGVGRAVRRFIGLIDEAAEHDTLTLPFLLEVEPGIEMARRMAEWPDPAYKVSGDIPGDSKRPQTLGEWPSTSRDMPIPETDGGLISVIGPYAILYAWTGERKYGQYAADCLRKLNTQVEDSYGDWHYAIERIVRAVPWLASGGFLDADERLLTDQLLLGTALETQGMWWRKRNGRPPLGHRHHGKGTFAFYLQARYLRDQARPNETARELCDRWIDECRAFLDALAQARADDQDDESTLNNLTTVFWYALGEERFDFFESGNALAVTERAIAIHDNMGAGAGVEGYGEGLPGSMYLQQDISVIVGASAYYYQDGQLKWVREHMPNLREPTRMILWVMSPAFMHRFDVGPEVVSEPPRRLEGLRALDLSPYQVDLVSDPPNYRPPDDVGVQDAEKWQFHNGLRPNGLPFERTFDKLVMRKSFDPQAPYLLLQGYDEPFRWQGSMHAANAIVRFSQGGHIFLVQNTDRQSYYHKNGVLVSDGFNDSTFPPLAERIATDDFPDAGLSVTRLNDAHHADWTRYVFWSKPGDGFFVVLDALEPRAAGPFAFVCTWRTPAYAKLDGRRWCTRQGDYAFSLCAGQDLDMISLEQGLQGASNPYVLHQRQAGSYQPGDCVSFHNLFYVRSANSEQAFDLRSIGPGAAIVVNDTGRVLAWFAMAPQGEGMTLGEMVVTAKSAMATREMVAVAGATGLKLPAGVGYQLTSDNPVGMNLDLKRCEMQIRADSPGNAAAGVRMAVGEETKEVTVAEGQPFVYALPPATCSAVRAWLETQMAEISNVTPVVISPSPDAPAKEWDPVWAFDGWVCVPERIRDVAVTTDPPPFNGFADQLIDTVLPEYRDAIAQWPDSDHYQISLKLGRETAIDRMRIVGDSLDQPALRTFHTLPEGIQAIASCDGFREDRRYFSQTRRGQLSNFRWHGWEDRFEIVEMPIEDQAHQIRLHLPAPAEKRALVCHEVEVYGQRQVIPPVRKLIAADLDGDGQREAVAVAMANDAITPPGVPGEIVVLDADGKVKWRWQASNLITHVSCHDLDGDGRKQVCVGLLGPSLVVLEPDGTQRQMRSYARYNEETPDTYFGWFYGIEGLGIWHRDSEGRAALVVGTYGMQVFLDTSGDPVGHAWAGGGAWQSGVLGCPPSGVGPKDVWVRNRWHQGICVYKGQPGLEHSGEYVDFGGLRQTMFRPLHRMMNFVSGRTIAFEWIPGSESAGGLVLAAAETGVGVLSFTQEWWLWKNESGGPITASIACGKPADPNAWVVVGWADGFVSAFGQQDGEPIRRLQTGAPIVGLACRPGSDNIIMANREAILVLDDDWQVTRRYPIPARKMCLLQANRALVAREDGVLEAIDLSEGDR